MKRWIRGICNKIWFWIKGIEVYDGFILDPHDPNYKYYKKEGKK